MPHQVDPANAGRRASQPCNSRKQSQHSDIAKSVLMSKIAPLASEEGAQPSQLDGYARESLARSDKPSAAAPHDESHLKAELKPVPYASVRGLGHHGVGVALSDTPVPTAPNSPPM